MACETTIQDTEDIIISKEESKETFIESQKGKSSWEIINIKLHDNAENFKREYFIVYITIALIINCFFHPFVADNIGKSAMAKTASYVKELPEKGAEIIYQIHENIETIVTENTSPELFMTSQNRSKLCCNFFK